MTIIDNKVLIGNDTIGMFNFIDKNDIALLEIEEVLKGEMFEICKISYPEYYTYESINLYFDNINSTDTLINHLENSKRNL